MSFRFQAHLRLAVTAAVHLPVMSTLSVDVHTLSIARHRDSLEQARDSHETQRQPRDTETATGKTAAGDKATRHARNHVTKPALM